MSYRLNEEPDDPEEFAVMYQQEAVKLRAENERLNNRLIADTKQWQGLISQHVAIESDLRDEVQRQANALREAERFILSAALSFDVREVYPEYVKAARAWLAKYGEAGKGDE